MSRDDALEKLTGIAYPSETDMQADVDYFLKKMKWTPQQLNACMARPEISHADYPSEKLLWDLLLAAKQKFFRFK
jgi:hypothetical protein